MSMKYLYSKIIIVLYSLLGLFLCACSSSQIFGFMGIKDEIDDKLPTIKTFRALADVTSIGFEWKTPSDIALVDGYIIYRENKNKKFEKIAFVQNALSTHYYDDKLQPQTEYVYAIASVGKDSRVSRKSTPLRVKTSFIDPVDFVYASQDYAQKIKIFWSPSSNPIVKNYIVERQDDDGKFITIGSTTNRMLVEFFDKNVENGTTHTYRVIAQSYDGAKSVPSKLVVGKARELPTTIQGIRTTDNKLREIWIEWNPSSSKDVIGYNVWSANNQTEEYRKIAFVTRESYIDKIDSNGAVRYYKITAVDRYKLESEPQEYGVVGQTLPPPIAPNLTKGAIENNYALIAWENGGDNRTISYNVYRKNGQGAFTKISQTTSTSFTDKNIQEGVGYTYFVTGIDKNNMESMPSRQVTLLLQPHPVAPKPSPAIQNDINKKSN